MTTTTWTIIEYRGNEGLERLEGDWRRLYAAMRDRSSHHSFEAHRAYAESLSRAPEELRYLALADEDRVRAICVLERGVERALGVPLPVWRVTQHPHSPLGDVICPEDDARLVLVPALLRYLRHHAEGRALLMLGPLPEHSVLWRGLKLLSPAKYYTYRPMSSFVFDCTRPFAEHAADWSRSFRRDLRRHRERLEALSDVSFATSAGDPAVSTAFETFLDVEASGWKGRNGSRSAIRFREGQPAFFRALASLREDGDRCEINTLHAEGKCIAAQFCMLTGRENGLHKSGYDETYSRESPGQLLIERTLQRCCEDPDIDRFSLISDSAWQRSWRPDAVGLELGYFAAGRLTGAPLIALLRFRFGRARRLVRGLREKREVYGAWWRRRRGEASSESTPVAASDGGSRAAQAGRVAS